MNDELKKTLDLLKNPLGNMSAAFARPVVPEFRMPQLPDSATNPAKWMYTRLKEYIKSFEGELDNNHEVGARLVSFGQSITFHIDDIGYYGPDIITFDGVDEKGQAVQLIQHTSQLSVLLIAMKKQTEHARRIGFLLDEKDKNASPEA